MRVEGSGFGVKGFRFRVQRFGVKGFRFRVQGSGLRLEWSGLRVEG